MQIEWFFFLLSRVCAHARAPILDKVHVVGIGNGPFEVLQFGHLLVKIEHGSSIGLEQPTVKSKEKKIGH